MYIVKRGRLQVVADDGFSVLATLGAGSVFGEVKLSIYTRKLFQLTSNIFFSRSVSWTLRVIERVIVERQT